MNFCHIDRHICVTLYQWNMIPFCDNVFNECSPKYISRYSVKFPIKHRAMWLKRHLSTVNLFPHTTYLQQTILKTFSIIWKVSINESIITEVWNISKNKSVLVKRAENIWQKKKLLVLINYVFKSRLLQMCQNVSIGGKRFITVKLNFKFPNDY